jgi:hypothetical protein
MRKVVLVIVEIMRLEIGTVLEDKVEWIKVCHMAPPYTSLHICHISKPFEFFNNLCFDLKSEEKNKFD